MRLVVDTNILFSFFRENPVRFIIISSQSLGIELFTPAHAIGELRANKSDLLKYSRLSSEQIESVIDELNNCISTISPQEYKECEQKAKQLSPHDKDVPIFALALRLGCVIWSNEPKFKQQDEVKVLSTKELFDLLITSE